MYVLVVAVAFLSGTADLNYSYVLFSQVECDAYRYDAYNRWSQDKDLKSVQTQCVPLLEPPGYKMNITRTRQ